MSISREVQIYPNMLFLRMLICFIVLVYVAAENEPNSNSDVAQLEISLSETSSVNNNATKESDSTAVPISNLSTTGDEIVKISGTGTGHDIEITGTATPPSYEMNDVEVSTGQNLTEFDNDTVEITTTENNELKSACSSNPCRNGGSCIEDATIPSLFSCSCVTGYVGVRCGTVDKCTTDNAGQFCKNGACIYSEDGLMRTCQCFSGQYWDDVEKKCRDPDPPCFPNPCMNGGICSSKDGKARCECLAGYEGENCTIQFKCGSCENGVCLLNDEQTTKYCECNEGLYWNEKLETCEVLTSPCDSIPCMNGGVCDASQNSTEFNCSCQIGFSGKTCEITDKCSENKDCGQGTCVLSEDKKLRTCQCNEGFYLEEQSQTCKEIHMLLYCQPNPCLHDGICSLVSVSSYNCTCSQGYTGHNCDVRDLCEMDGGKAFCGNGTCNNNYGKGLYFCTCNEREYFQYIQRECIGLDMCPLVQCNSNEMCVMGECKCKEHYTWDNTTLKCMPDFCSSQPCPLPEMICEEGTGKTDYKCHCPEGLSFNGTHCNEASCLFPQLNLCKHHCSITEEGYECSCSEGFVLNEDNHTCTYVGNSTCTNKTCENGVCVKRDDDMEECICSPGFTEIDGACKDTCSLGELTSGICPSDQCETTTEGGFRCKCEGKFTLSKDKTTCTVRNICEVNEIGWKTCTNRNAECVTDWMSTNGYKCTCASGQVVTEGGICRDVCSIENNQRQCSIRGATCDVDGEGRMICKCPPYFKANERDGKCSRPADFSYLITLPLDKSTYLAQNRKKRSLDPSIDYRRVSSDVTTTMLDMFRSFTQANILSCKSTSEYIFCKIELQFTSESESDLKRLEEAGICLSDGTSNACLLPPSLVLVKNKIIDNVKIKLTDPCEEEIKNEVCGSETTCVSALSQKSFNCSCNPGFYARKKNYPFGDTRSFIETCSDINECEERNPCPVNSNCENTIGSYRCTCKPGYRPMKDTSGITNQKCVEVCRPNPCMHGHCLRRGDDNFDCRCEAGYAGRLCNMQDEHFKRAKINTIVVGVVLGGALLITFILFAACISRLRKKKMIENAGHLFYNSTEMAERRRAEGGAINNAFQRE